MSNPESILAEVELLTEVFRHRTTLLKITTLLSQNGCDCECTCIWNGDEHSEYCDVCFPCRVAACISGQK